MNKKIISGIILVVALTSIILYRKYQRAEARAQQEQIDKELREEIQRGQVELQHKRMREEEQRRLDSIVEAQNTNMQNGLQMLKEAKENLLSQ